MKLLRHPHVITLEEVMETAEHVFFVMELCPGGNLADHVAIEVLFFVHLLLSKKALE